MVVGCQRAKPARTVIPPPASPRVETPLIAQVAAATVTAVAGAGYPYPAPAHATPATPIAQAAYPVTAAPPATATVEPSEPPTVEPSPQATETIAAAPTASPAPTLAATPRIAPPTPVPVVLYRVKAGDSLGAIAVLYNTTAAAIMAYNSLSDPSLIHAGQTLIIPASSPQAIPSGSTVRHTVQAGETLADICSYYRTTADAILAQNPTVSDPANLPEGTVLIVIVGSEAGARTHVVQAGETLGLIAERYGLTTQQLARANGLTDPSSIRVGQRLVIP